MKNRFFSETPKSDHLHRLCASSKRRASASSPLPLSNRTTLTLWALHRITLSPAPADALIPHCLKGAEAATGRSWGQGTSGGEESESTQRSGGICIKEMSCTWRTEAPRITFLRTEMHRLKQKALSAGVQVHSVYSIMYQIWLELSQ